MYGQYSATMARSGRRFKRKTLGANNDAVRTPDVPRVD
jgi:hypothetical protein